MNKESYREQIEKWNKIHSHHNADKIILYQIEQQTLKQADLFPNTSHELAENQKKNNELLVLQQDQFQLLKKELVKDLEGNDWMFSVPNHKAGRPPVSASSSRLLREDRGGNLR